MLHRHYTRMNPPPNRADYCSPRDSFTFDCLGCGQTKPGDRHDWFLLFSKRKTGYSACRRAIVSNQKHETCFLLGRDFARATVAQHRKIINPKEQSLTAAPDILPVSHSFY